MNKLKLESGMLDMKKIKQNLDFFRLERCSKCKSQRIFLVTKNGLHQKEIKSLDKCNHKWVYVFQYRSTKLKDKNLYFGRSVIYLK